MGKATGVFLILAGLGTASLILPSVDKDSEQQLADVVRIATGAAQQTALVQPSAVPVTMPPPSASESATGTLKSLAAMASIPTAAVTETNRAPVLISPPQAVVRTAQIGHPSDTQSRQTLARDIQRELKRVGCYDGDVNGDWDGQSRRAMKAFIDKVNAALPVDEPDHILKTMVQGHPGHACGGGCPSGQTANEHGHCRPAAVVAQGHAREGTRTTEIARAPDSRLHDVVVAQREPAPVQPSVPRAAWETTVVTAPAPILAVPTAVARNDDTFNGRMAAGAPLPQPAVNGLSTSTPAASQPASNSRAQVPGVIAALGGGVVAAQQDNAGIQARPTQNRDTTATADQRRRTHVYHEPPSEKFKFPTPQSYLGAKQRPSREPNHAYGNSGGSGGGSHTWAANFWKRYSDNR